jgi:hypothetical protein
MKNRPFRTGAVVIFVQLLSYEKHAKRDASDEAKHDKPNRNV